MQPISLAGRLSILTCAILGVSLLVLAPYQYFNWRTAEKTKLSETRQQVVRLKKTLASLKASSAETVDDEVRTAFEGDYLQGENEQLILADLQTKLRSKISEYGCQLFSARILPKTKDNGMEFIGLRLEVLGDLEGIRNVLHAVETQRPYLFIRQASIKLATGSIATGDLPERALPKMSLSVDVFGAMWSATGVSGG